MGTVVYDERTGQHIVHQTYVLNGPPPPPLQYGAPGVPPYYPDLNLGLPPPAAPLQPTYPTAPHSIHSQSPLTQNLQLPQYAHPVAAPQLHSPSSMQHVVPPVQ